MIGKTLGHYEITDKLGQGGMGSVWLAQDSKLGRQVAIKTLPEEFARDEERLARFEREAKLLASLNHPNIATIHGLEEDTGTRFLVLELIEGDTLADRLKRGAIPVEESLKLALQIAEALEAAHEKGVIHRDLKPGNIKVTPEGKVKVLDFGLAKAFAGDGADANLSQSPTLSMAATQQGIILGTAAYMSPEQARGQEVDKRADVWAFGCVLFEMLTGRRAFPGDLATDILAAVIRAEPGWEELPPRLHPAIRKLIERCLEKETRNRWHSVADVRVDIEQTLADPEGLVYQVFGTSRISRKQIALLLIAAAAIGSAFGVFAETIARVWLGTGAPASASYLEVSIEPLEQLAGGSQLHALSRPTMTLTPNGRQLVLAGTTEGTQQLFLRSLDQQGARPIAGTEGAMSPFFSPSGQEIGYVANGQLWKVGVSGELPVPLAPIAGSVMGVHWGPSGNIVFGQQPGGGLWVVSDSGGTPRQLTEVEQTSGVSHRLPWVLPGGEAVLYTVFRTSEGWEAAQVVVESLVNGTRQVLLDNAANPAYTASGHLLFMRLGALWAVPFDLATLALDGEPIPVLGSVTQATRFAGVGNDTGAGQFAVSDSGSLAYLPGGLLAPQTTQLVWVDRDGRNREPVGLPPGRFFSPRISPDGGSIAVSDGIEATVLIYDLLRDTPQSLQGDGHNVGAWSPDGDRIAFGRAVEAGSRNLFWQPVDGSQPPQPLTKPGGNIQFAGAWVPDGSELLFVERSPGTGGENILILDTERPEEEPRPILQEPHNEWDPALSPDGRWLAYASDETGQYEVYVVSYPDLADKRTISDSGGRMPAWSVAGDELFYWEQLGNNGPGAMKGVAIQTSPSFQPGAPSELFRGTYQTGNFIRSYDVARDGRFLMNPVNPTDGTRGTVPLRIVLNFFEELKERVPVP